MDSSNSTLDWRTAWSSLQEDKGEACKLNVLHAVIFPSIAFEPAADVHWRDTSIPLQQVIPVKIIGVYLNGMYSPDQAKKAYLHLRG